MSEKAEKMKTPETNTEIKDFEITKLDESRYIDPYRLTFKQNDHKRVWDGVNAHSGVSCLIYNLDKNNIILVRQFRPVIFVSKVIDQHDSDHKLENLDWSKVHPDQGFTFELCAGLCDKNKSLHETIKEEIMEECGYKVDIENIHKLSQSRSAGLFGALHTIFYCEVKEVQKVGTGGGNADEGEFIDLYELSVDSIREFIDNESFEKPLGVMYALKWFLYERDEFMAKKLIAKKLMAKKMFGKKSP